MQRFDAYPRVIRDLINEYGALVEALLKSSDDAEWLRRNAERLAKRNWVV